MKRTIRKIWNALTSLLVAAAILLAVLLVGVKFTGLEVFTVLSGSMEPTYKTGSVIYVREADALEPGDVITYHLNGDTVATHRIVELVEENGTVSYRTKGDANDVTDAALVSASQIIGTPIFTIPQLGYLATYLQTTSGRYAAFAAGALLLLLVILPDLIMPEKKQEREKRV